MARVAAWAGMGLRGIVRASLAAAVLCGVSMVAPTAAGPSGEWHAASSDIDDAPHIATTIKEGKTPHPVT